MKMTKKKVLVIALAISLVAILSMGTLAWFTAEDTIENKFHFADSDNDDKTDFSVDVIESNDDEGDGLEFDNILPGQTVDKDPTIVNTSTADNYSQYIRVTLTLKDPQGAWKKAYDEGRIGNGGYLAFLDEMFKTVDRADTWELVGGEGIGYGYDENAGEFFWKFYYREVLKPGESVVLFEQVTIPTGLTVEDANAMMSDFDVTVKAEAIQSENLGLAYSSASNAFKLVD